MVLLRKNRYTGGFTILEMLIVVSVTGLLLVGVVLNFREGRQDDVLRLAAIRVGDTLRTAQTLANTGSQEQYGFASLFGVRVEKNEKQMWLFADAYVDPVNSVIGRWDGPGTAQAPKDILVRDMVQPISIDPEGRGEIEIGSLKIDGAEVGGVFLDIAYKRSPLSALLNSADAGSEAIITLRHTKSAHTRTVAVNRLSGSVNVEY